MRKHAAELRSLVGNLLLRLQSKKIIDRLPQQFRDIPILQRILLRKGLVDEKNEDGPNEYDESTDNADVMKSKAETSAEDVDYAQEYANEILEVDVNKYVLLSYSRVIMY